MFLSAVAGMAQDNHEHSQAMESHHPDHMERRFDNAAESAKDFDDPSRRVVPPCVTFDDLASAGTIGLIQAVDRFDQTRGLKFRTYAQHRIWGAMQDFLREEDPLSRTERRRVRASAPALSATGYGIPPVTVSLDQIPVRRLASPAQPAFALRPEVREARRSLSPRENRVIELLHNFGWQGREVAVENARQREPHLSNQTARDFKASRLPGARKLTEGRIMRPCNAWTFRRVSSIDSRFCISQRIQLEAQSISLYNC
jgi:RNA polymerase sigma factor (sigma-70 family)